MRVAGACGGGLDRHPRDVRRSRLDERGALRNGLDSRRATDLVVVLFGHDVFRGLVIEASRSVSAYKAWLFPTLVQQLLKQSRLAPTAFADLSYASLLAKT
jgi:TetR/AcrR family transcriptional regulator of autoinduction and epiphytic fitness